MCVCVLFICSVLAVLGLRCSGLSLVAVLGLLTAVAPLVCRPWALGHWAQ